jgi:hypothetical protein
MAAGNDIVEMTGKKVCVTGKTETKIKYLKEEIY